MASVRERDVAVPTHAVRLPARVRVGLNARAAPAIALGSIFALSVLCWTLVARLHLIPDLFPDELIYAKVSQSLAYGHGLSWRGSDWGSPPLWPVILSLAWHFGSVPQGYAVAKAITVVVASLTVVPVWLLGRELVGPRLALVPAALSVMGAWMNTTGFVLSDNLAYPLATASLASTVMAVRSTRGRWIVASVAFAIPAVLTRTQLLVLPVILVVALAIDVVRQPRDERRGRIASRPRELWIGLTLLVVAGLIAFVVHPDITHYAVLTHHVSISAAAQATGRQVADAILLFAFVPVVAAVALMAPGANWRDDRLGPVLATLLASTLVLFPVLGRFEAYGTNGPVDRYVMYLAPLLFIVLVIAPGRFDRRVGFGVAVAAAASMFALPRFENFIEQPAIYGSTHRVTDLQPFVHHVDLGIALVALVVSVFSVVALTTRERRATAVAGVLAAVVVVMIAQAWTSENAETGLISRSRSVILPPRLDWVDAHVNGPAAELVLGRAQRLVGNFDEYTDFFNRRVSDVYSNLSAGGHECQVGLVAGGKFTFAASSGCPPWPRYLVVENGPLKPTLYGQRTIATTAQRGTLVEIPPGTPRVHGLVSPPCLQRVCSGAVLVSLFLDQPGTLAITFGAASVAHRVSVDGAPRQLTPGRPNTIAIPALAGDRRYVLQTDWSTPQGAPPLQSVTLRSGSATTQLW